MLSQQARTIDSCSFSRDPLESISADLRSSVLLGGDVSGGPFCEDASRPQLETSKRSSTHTTSHPIPSARCCGEKRQNLTESYDIQARLLHALQQFEHALCGRVIIASLPDEYGSRLRFPSPFLL